MPTLDSINFQEHDYFNTLSVPLVTANNADLQLGSHKITFKRLQNVKRGLQLPFGVKLCTNYCKLLLHHVVTFFLDIV